LEAITWVGQDPAWVVAPGSEWVNYARNKYKLYTQVIPLKLMTFLVRLYTQQWVHYNFSHSFHEMKIKNEKIILNTL
jgi:hypothetical protein